jgi:hypothetical protein
MLSYSCASYSLEIMAHRGDRHAPKNAIRGAAGSRLLCERRMFLEFIQFTGFTEFTG